MSWDRAASVVPGARTESDLAGGALGKYSSPASSSTARIVNRRYVRRPSSRPSDPPMEHQGNANWVPLCLAIEECEQKRDSFPRAGRTIGWHAGVLVVKHIRFTSRERSCVQRVWAGRLVKWAWRCAQNADAHQLICTKSVYRKFDDINYVADSSGYQVAGSSSSWEGADLSDKLPADQVGTKVPTWSWCAVDGDGSWQAILGDMTDGDDLLTAGFRV